MRETKEITCIVCPSGCRLSVVVEDGRAVEITGNTCKRGADYGATEAVAPMRTVTSTVRICKSLGGGMLPVKTAVPVSKSQIFDVMAALRHVTVRSPVNIGDTILTACGVPIISGGDRPVNHCPAAARTGYECVK